MKPAEDAAWKGAGGSPGGVKLFLIGSIMAIVGGYLLLNQVTVHSGFWRIFNYNAFGITLIPFLFGIGFLFYNSKSIVGWILTVGGLLIIFTGILTNLEIYFRPTSLWNTLTMLVLLVGGLALVFRSLHSFRE
jgi:uncharacterized protein